MTLRPCLLLIVAACGGKSAATQDVSNTGEPADDGVREPSAADCPDEAAALEALAPGWEYLDDWTSPQLDLCLRGRFPDDGVLVYASSRPDADSQTEVGWPARRVVFGLDGAIRLEGPGDGGSWLMDPAQPLAGVDLDGDGDDEVLQSTMLDPETTALEVLGIVDGELVVIGAYALDVQGEEASCRMTWKLGDPGPGGARAIVLEPGECTGAEPHHITVGSDGMLVDDQDSSEEEDLEDVRL